MHRLFVILLMIFATSSLAFSKSGKSAAKDGELNIFIPDSDCFPDPVLDSISIVGDKVMVQDHLITSGELSYVMHRVNFPLYEKNRVGQVKMLVGGLSAFVGGAMVCTGYFWTTSYTGERKHIGVTLLSCGVPITAGGLTVFAIGLKQSASARRQFKRSCLGVASLDLNVGVGSLGLSATF